MVDLFIVRAFDFHGHWEDTTGLQTKVFSTVHPEPPQSDNVVGRGGNQWSNTITLVIYGWKYHCDT